jgi:hypothetical protein
MINFCFDHIINKDNNLVYPNLGANIEGNFTEICGIFSITYPFSDPPRLLDYLSSEDVPFELHTTNECPFGSFYLINVNFFDHTVDWIARMTESVRLKLQNKQIKVLFCYGESDNPLDIRNTLHEFANKHKVDVNQIHFISHNTIAKQIQNFYYFNDNEMLFRSAQNYSNSQSKWHNNPRSKKFTCLIRSHKNWRFIIGAKLHSLGINENSYSSYNKIEFSDGFNHTDDFIDARNNPLHNILLDDEIENFNAIIPFSPDTLIDDDRNDYEMFVDRYFTDSYWNIVIETHLNLYETTGTYITEKTWKPIRHNQPFVVMGTVGTLSHLRSMGYRTFDGIIDESYDYIKNDDLRFQKVMDIIETLNSKSIEELNDINLQVKEIVQHNSALFNGSKRERLLHLTNQLHTND